MPLQGGYLSEPSQLWAWVVFGGSLLSVQSFTEVTDITIHLDSIKFHQDS